VITAYFLKSKRTLELRRRKGKKVFLEGQHDLLIALGGGSSIDTAKVISCLATNEGTVKDYLGVVVYKNDPIPIIAIPTTAGTGSEVTYNAIVTDTAAKLKLFTKKFNTPCRRSD
jgi:alcohol dehydrogenase